MTALLLGSFELTSWLKLAEYQDSQEVSSKMCNIRNEEVKFQLNALFYIKI